MSYNYSVLHYSSEFIALCQAQITLLNQMTRANWSGVYLTESLTEGQETKLVPVVSYPKKGEFSSSQEYQPRLLDRVYVANDTLLEIPHTTFEDISEPKLIVQPLQLVIPLIYNDVVIGILVTRRENLPWNEQELQQIDPIAKTIAIAGIWELRQRWYQEQLDEQQTLQIGERNRLDDFLHQFRNPLTAIRTFTKLLLRKLLPEDKNYGIAQSLLRESERLQELLQEFADLGESVVPAKIIIPEVPLLSLPNSSSRENTLLQRDIFSVGEILQPLVISAQAIAQERKIKFSAHIPSELPLIEANKKALREVLSNLIDNALKYTPRGGTVQINIKQNQSRQGIEIADTGYGIPPLDQSHIFERHYRGVQAEGDIAGSGLGLAIAKELIDKMNGTIELISPNEFSKNQTFSGTTFIIWLPLAS